MTMVVNLKLFNCSLLNVNDLATTIFDADGSPPLRREGWCLEVPAKIIGKIFIYFGCLGSVCFHMLLQVITGADYFLASSNIQRGLSRAFSLAPLSSLSPVSSR